MAKSSALKNPGGKILSLSRQGIGLLLISAAVLCFEVNMTRLFSVSQFYHFAFLVVSIALLGSGASGTYLALRRVPPGKPEIKLLPWLAGLTGVSMLGSYLLVNRVPFDSFRIALEPAQVAILMLHYAVLAAPFFFSGMAINLMLREHQGRSGEVYALNLLGSASGCFLAVLLPPWVNGEGVVLVSVIVAAISGWFFIFGEASTHAPQGRRLRLAAFLLVCVLFFALIPFGSRLLSGEFPEFIEINLSPYKGLSYALQPLDARLVSSRWNGYSRVDVVSSPSLHSVPGMSYRYTGSIPAIQGLFIDGDNLNPILTNEGVASFYTYLPAQAAYQLRPDARVLILDPKGGLAIQAAVASGAVHVTAVEANPLVVEASPGAYQQEGVDWVYASGRSFLRSIRGGYDIVELPLTDSYHPVSSGAYALGEDFRYTLESVEAMLQALNQDGILVMTRWLQELPTEWLRAFTLVVTALEGQGLDPTLRIVALRGYNTGTLLVKRMPFTAEELTRIRDFASTRAFDLSFAPHLEVEELNRFNILPEPIYYQTFTQYLEADSREAFYQDYAFDVKPPTDDHPFFGHYFKWSQLDDVLRSFGVTWQPFGGAGYLVILILLGLALVLSGGLILLPIMVVKAAPRKLINTRAPYYFGLIGLAFMLVEVPLIQKFILYLDQPAFAFTAVLFCILMFSGIGSWVGARRLPLYQALMGLLGVVSLHLLLLPWVFTATQGASLGIRSLITLLVLAPLGFFMGMPFPAGMRWITLGLGRDAETLRWWMAWMWALNGAGSVIASILASMLSLRFGFTLTLAIGAALYALAWALVLSDRRQSLKEKTL